MQLELWFHSFCPANSSLIHQDAETFLGYCTMQRAAPGDLEGLIFDEDSDDNINLAKLAGADDAGVAAAADGASGNLNEKADEPKLLKRNKRQRPRFTETDLLGSMGLEWIQRNIPRMLAGSIKGKRGSEVRILLCGACSCFDLVALKCAG